MQAEIKVLHWQTTVFSEHMAFGGFYDVADELIDKLIEAIQGKYSTRILIGGIDSIQISDYSNLKINIFIQDMEAFFAQEIWTCGISKNDTELANIIDEIKGEIDKLKYLLTLK